MKLFRSIHIFIFTISFVINAKADACRPTIESYLLERTLSSSFENVCDENLDCIELPKLIKELKNTNVYRVFVSYGNGAGYPSDDIYEVTTDKACKVLKVSKLR